MAMANKQRQCERMTRMGYDYAGNGEYKMGSTSFVRSGFNG